MQRNTHQYVTITVVGGCLYAMCTLCSHKLIIPSMNYFARCSCVGSNNDCPFSLTHSLAQPSKKLISRGFRLPYCIFNNMVINNVRIFMQLAFTATALASISSKEHLSISIESAAAAMTMFNDKHFTQPNIKYSN